jgi:flagellar FliL protein
MAKESVGAGGVTGKAGGAAALHVPDVPVAAGGKAEGKKGRSAMKITVLMLVILILLAGLGLGGWYLLGSASASFPPPEGEGAATEGAADGSHKGEAAKPTSAPKVTGLLALEPFTVNLADTESTRYVRLNVKLGLNAVEAVESFKKDEIVNAKVRDAIIGLLGSLTADNVLSADGKAKLRKDIADKTNAILQEGQVLEVYFIELVVQ